MAVDPELARQLKHAAQKVAEWTERRDALIRRACQEGGSLREIGGLTGFTHSAISKILQRTEK